MKAFCVLPTGPGRRSASGEMPRSCSTETPRTLASLGRISERGGLSLCSQKVMFCWVSPEELGELDLGKAGGTA